MARIKVIEPKEATGRLKQIYEDLIQKRGQLAEVHKMQSLRPESIVKHMELYMEIMFSKSELSRAEREMIAVVTSVSNKCQYCQMHHSEALNHYWKDEEKIIQLQNDYKKLKLNEREMALCQFSEVLTKYPYDLKEPEMIQKLKQIGLSDEAVLDAALVVSYFNFVNRMVLSLGVKLEKDQGKGYKY